MHPVKAEADGHFVYLFIMNPMIIGADYGVESLLNPKAAQKFKMFKDAIIERNYKEFLVTQTKDWIPIWSSN